MWWWRWRYADPDADTNPDANANANANADANADADANANADADANADANANANANAARFVQRRSARYQQSRRRPDVLQHDHAAIVLGPDPVDGLRDRLRCRYHVGRVESGSGPHREQLPRCRACPAPSPST
ncbi:hypothetical protein LP420_40050 [Massilia sp. B-10]|nr:hypothetical protein LP420_40050 [Massilia sp. B-10]